MRDPRRLRGHFRIHLASIVTLLAVASATVAVRSSPDKGPILTERSRRGVTAADGLGPLSGPPSRPAGLDADLATIGYTVPEGANAYAVRVVEGPKGRVYEQYEAGGGALAGNFWPASSIKVLAALGALDFARSLGYSGAASVSFDDGGPTRTLRSIYQPAIRDSSNYDYDLLVRIAGRDHLNGVFLTAGNGFPVTAISRSYSGLELDESPAMIFTEGDRRTYVAARKAELASECPGNCSNLFEMTESVRRIVLNDQLPAEQRFDLDATDLKELAVALLSAQGFFITAVKGALGAGARIYSKPGDADGLDCLDVAFIQSKNGDRFLLAATVPHRVGGCAALSRLARGVLEVLSG